MATSKLVGNDVTCPVCRRGEVRIIESTNYSGAEIGPHYVPWTLLVRCPMSGAPVEPRCDGEHAAPSCRDAQCWQRDPSIVEWHHPIVDSASTMNITGCACGWRPRVYSWRHIPGELSQNDVDDQYARYLALAKNSPPHARGCDIHSGEECSHEPGCPRDR